MISDSPGLEVPEMPALDGYYTYVSCSTVQSAESVWQPGEAGHVHVSAHGIKFEHTHDVLVLSASKSMPLVPFDTTQRSEYVSIAM